MALLGTCGIPITGGICVAAVHYANLVQDDWNNSNQFKAHVASLSESLLESRQITSDFLHKPSEMFLARYAQNQSASSLSSVKSKSL
ncbi:hypothetical protein [Bradyrhizobium zhanjiangense]|uniref:hypothetical protein n=1 Tax=Bradyrhizobium zhanjiangense TaxID=1325107 RepID=UPI001008E013|nr:hypothetical protein [Bradyrhizobium zhanjiangense]